MLQRQLRLLGQSSNPIRHLREAVAIEERHSVPGTALPVVRVVAVKLHRLPPESLPAQMSFRVRKPARRQGQAGKALQVALAKLARGRQRVVG